MNLIHVIIIAKSIIDEQIDLISSVQLDRRILGDDPLVLKDFVGQHVVVSKLKRVVEKAVNIIIPDNTTVDIKIFKHNDDYFQKGSRLAGMVLTYDGFKHTIHINGNESYCTQRFALCKELMQIFVDYTIFANKSRSNPDKQLVEAVTELLRKFYDPNVLPEIEDVIDSSEAFAHALSLEILIPYTMRDKIQKWLLEGKSHDYISNQLFITIETLEEYLKNHFSVTTPIYKLLED